MKIKMIPAGLYAANCYILIDDENKVGCIIDPGGDEKILEDEINSSNIELKFILLTHGHQDHTGAVDYIKRKYNIPVYINGKDKKLMREKSFVFGSMWQEDKDDKEVSEGDILEVGNLKIKCLETPGHTPGGMCYLVDNVVFTGDTLFHGSIGRTDFPGGSFDKLIDSINKKLMVLKDDIIVLPGHESKSNIGFEREFNPFL